MQKNKDCKMVSIIKPLVGTVGEVSLANSNNVSNSALVRVINTSASTTYLLNFANTTAVYANITLLANSVTYVQKATTDTLNATSSSVRAVAIAFRD